jgi:hypothetical protein
MKNTANTAVWTNENGELCLRYFGGYICRTEDGWLAYSRDGSIFGPIECERDAKDMLDMWGVR